MHLEVIDWDYSDFLCRPLFIAFPKGWRRSHEWEGSSQSEGQHSSSGDLFTAFQPKDSQLHCRKITNLPEKCGHLSPQPLETITSQVAPRIMGREFGKSPERGIIYGPSSLTLLSTQQTHHCLHLNQRRCKNKTFLKTFPSLKSFQIAFTLWSSLPGRGVHWMGYMQCKGPSLMPDSEVRKYSEFSWLG